MRYIYINRDCDKERRDEFCALNAHIPELQRFSAIDGTSLDPEELAEKGIITPGLRYSRGALGSAMSHLLLWNAVSEKNEPACIFEDDAILCANFKEESSRLLAGLPEDWDIVLWGNNYDTALTFNVLPGISPCVAIFDQESLRKGADKFPSMTISSMLFPLAQTLGICGYTISPVGARKMMTRCLPLKNDTFYHHGLACSLPSTSIDHVMAHFYVTMKSFVSFPSLCITKNDASRSTILHSNRMTKAA